MGAHGTIIANLTLSPHCASYVVFQKVPIQECVKIKTVDH